ncbi:hypothetical protein IAD21_01743 [Abditibacteriota bacterium]|nr:hypothetical protein IAD21_01743 [Abditibacteriota bacterium]
MKRFTPETRLLVALLSAIPAALILAGCGGGSSTQIPIPASYEGTYVGTYSATYDPRSPLTGITSGTLIFLISSDGVVTVTTPGFASGTQSGIQIVVSGNDTAFGLRLLQGQLQVDSGQVTGSGTITVVSQSELAYGTWQAQKQ